MFDSASRYASLATSVYTRADGRQITYVQRRFLPRGDDLSLLVELTVSASDRLDLMANRTLGAPEAWWWIGDANDGMNPPELLEEAGEKLRIPIPRI